MDDNEWRELIETMQANVRPHAGYFAWLTDRTLEEYGVVQTLHESLAETGEAFFHSFESRGAGNDPPDCQALSYEGHLIGIEVTELVDGASIGAVKAKQPTNWQPFTKEHLLGQLASRIARKDNSEIQGGPYETYVLVIYCDEPRVLDFDLIQSVRTTSLPRPKHIDRAFLLLSYSPWEKRCPCIELQWQDV